MSAQFNWHNLDPELRLGSHPEELITLYRGFRPDQLTSDGFLSSAAQHNDLSGVEHAIREAGTMGWPATYLSTHALSSDPEVTGKLTPFVSATEDRAIAENYAGGSNERIAIISLQASRLVLGPLHRYEAFVLDRIGLEEILDIVDAPTRKPPGKGGLAPGYTTQIYVPATSGVGLQYQA